MILEVWKVVTVLEDGRLVSSALTSGSWSVFYTPGLETQPNIEGSLLFACVSEEDAINLQKQRSNFVRTEVWKANAETVHESEYCGRFATTGIGFELFWKFFNDEALENLDPKYLEKANPGTVFCRSLTLTERLSF